MTNNSSPQTRKYVRQALEHYACFFASLAQGDDDSAEKSLREIHSTDLSAGEALEDSEMSYYRTRRSYLMKIFRDQLMVQLQGQLQEDLFEKARTLAEEIEIEITRD